MPYVVRKGVPEILELWKRFLKEHKQGVIGADDRELFKRWSKAIRLLRDNPKHPGLNSHEIADLTQRFGRKVFQFIPGEQHPGRGANVLGVWTGGRPD